MNKTEMRFLLRRYRFIVKLMAQNKISAVIVYGGKRERLAIDDNTKKFIDIVHQALDMIDNDFSRKIMKQTLMSGDTDYYVFLTNGLTKSIYYNIKREFTENIFRLCILNGMVTLEDLQRSSGD